MKKIYLIALLFFIGLKISNAQISISGNLKDEATNEPLIGASILVKGTVAGTVTNSKGEFLIKTTMALPVVLKISLIGYETKEITYSTSTAIMIKLKEENRTLEQVNITANRVEESITKSPVTVEKLSAKQIQNSPSADVYSALQNIKGIDLLTQSLGFKSVNIRGFGANNNNRFVQLTDGMDNRSPGLGFGFGNVAGISDIDIESIEILPGAASALYGPDALQGIMITKSKSAFEYQGLTAQAKF